MGWFSSKKERPDSNDVAIRAIVLRHVVAYAAMTPSRETLDSASIWWTEDEKRAFARDAKATRDAHWAALGRYKKFLSPLELAFSRTTRDTMTATQLINASWRIEALVPLLWALGTVEGLPHYDTQSTAELFADFPRIEADEFISNAKLRDNHEINLARDVAEAWHWRSRTRQMIEADEPFPSSPELSQAGFTSFDSIVRSSAKMHEGDGTFSQGIDEDYPVFGKAYRELTADEWATVRSITMERHFALNWLCGHSPGHRWDETPTDT